VVAALIEGRDTLDAGSSIALSTVFADHEGPALAVILGVTEVTEAIEFASSVVHCVVSTECEGLAVVLALGGRDNLGTES
jgi:hypothetical protein